MKPIALGLSLGIMWGVTLFFTTWISYFTGHARAFLEIMAGSLYPGYRISPLGSLLGLIYGFADLFIMGVVIGWLYNRIARV